MTHPHAFAPGCRSGRQSIAGRQGNCPPLAGRDRDRFGNLNVHQSIPGWIPPFSPSLCRIEEALRLPDEWRSPLTAEGANF